MIVLKYIFWFLWRIWFYILILIAIILLSPALLVTIWNDKSYPYFFKLARLWAMFVFYGMGFRYEVILKERMIKDRSYMFVANHTSMMDIMLMLIVVKNNPFVFVGKKELAKLPIFGYFYKRTCILVDRNDSKSKMAVFEAAQRRLDKGLSICIFPEGGVPDDTSIVLDTFKDGAFRLAVDYQIPIVPITFGNLKHHFSFRFFSGYPGKIPVVVHEFIVTEGLSNQDKKGVKEATRKVMLDELERVSEPIRKRNRLVS